MVPAKDLLGRATAQDRTGTYLVEIVHGLVQSLSEGASDAVSAHRLLVTPDVSYGPLLLAVVLGIGGRSGQIDHPPTRKEITDSLCKACSR